MFEKKNGFTLVELILSIVLFSIISYIGLSILKPVIEGYVDTKTKTLLFNEAQFAVERIGIELRNAIPNTIRVGNGYLQFAAFSQSAYYKQISEDNITYYSSLNFPRVGDNASIYNTKPEYLYTTSRMYKILNINGDTLEFNKEISPSSPYHRVYIISTPVTFYIKNGKIYRSFDYPIDEDVYGIDKGQYYIVANYVYSLKFSYTPGNFLHSGIVAIYLVMKKNGVELKYEHEVHIKNVP